MRDNEKGFEEFQFTLDDTFIRGLTKVDVHHPGISPKTYISVRNGERFREML